MVFLIPISNHLSLHVIRLPNTISLHIIRLPNTLSIRVTRLPNTLSHRLITSPRHIIKGPITPNLVALIPINIQSIHRIKDSMDTTSNKTMAAIIHNQADLTVSL